MATQQLLAPDIRSHQVQAEWKRLTVDDKRKILADCATRLTDVGYLVRRGGYYLAAAKREGGGRWPSDPRPERQANSQKVRIGLDGPAAVPRRVSPLPTFSTKVQFLLTASRRSMHHGGDQLSLEP